MSDVADAELGPIDYIVVEFPAGAKNFTGEMAKRAGVARRRGHHSDARPADPRKGRERRHRGYEIEDLGDLGELAMLETSLAEILALEDVEHLAAAMEPGSTAGRPRVGELVGGAVRGRGPQVRRSAHCRAAASRRKRLIAAFEADAASTEGA